MLASPRGHERAVRRGAVGLLAAVVVAATALVTAPSPAGAALPTGPAAVTAGSADWGVRASFREYIVDPNRANGTITVTPPATTNGDGTFRFASGTGTYAGSTGELDASFSGSVHFLGHGGQLDVLIGAVRVEIDSATSGTLRADVVSKTFPGGVPTTYDDVAFANLNLTGITPSEAGSTFTWSNIPATLTAAGSAAFANFYPAGAALDPVTTSVTLAPTWTPQIVVSKTTGLDPAGETVTVTGSGFNPNANISTRPPVPPGMPTGVYVVFGRFGDPWKPSQGAPSTARRVIDQKWPLPAASKAAAEAAFGPNPQYVVMQPDGSFTTTLNIAPNETFTGSYGIATYAAGGAAPNASQETFTPMSFIEPTGTDASGAVPDFTVRGNKDDSKFSVEVTNADVNTFAVSPADVDVTVEVNGVEVSDPITPSSTTTKTLKAGKVAKFNYLWTHGASLQAGDVVTVTACVNVANDDTPSNSCATTSSPTGTIDLSNTTTLATTTTKKSSITFKTSLTNNGTAQVLLRPDDVSYTVFVNDQPAGGTVTSKTELGKRKIVKPTKVANYSFTWEHGAVSIGDELKVVTCTSVPGDTNGTDNCSTAVYLVTK